MKIYKVIFSPTGGSEKVADLIAKELGNDIETIDLSNPNFKKSKVESDSISVIAIPSFGGRAPEIAIDRLKMINGNESKAITVAVYGNRAQEDTLLEITNATKDSNYNVIAGIAAIAEHSIAHQYATGRPNLDDAEQLKEFVKQINDKSSNKTPSIPGNYPYKNSGSGPYPKSSSKCVSCGLCANRCPVMAIDKNNPKKTDKKICVSCMRCISVCPQNARKNSKILEKIIGFALKKECKNPKENELFL